MPWRISYIFLAVLCLNGFTRGASGQTSRNLRKTNSNIEFDKENGDSVYGSGGGSMLDVTDDEDFTDLGSGSGSGLGEIDAHVPMRKTTPSLETTHMMKTTTTTGRPLSNCEKNRQASRQLVGRYVPRCLPNGDFDSLQCHGHPGTADCWCSDLEGREIPGTLMEAPNYPSCDDGSNLPPCVHQLFMHVRSKLSGSFRPRCSVDGQFDRMQCHGSMCFCVDENNGKRVPGTEVHLPDRPSCDDSSDADVDAAETTTKKFIPDRLDPQAEGGINIDDMVEPKKSPSEDDTTDEYDLDGNTGSHEETSKDKDSNKSGTKAEAETKESGHQESKVEKASEIMTQPGILAGIIGGSVVLLLCIVLLVMFIVYRMRKKDEGSYPLDEPRKTPNYSYVRAPEKEFYA